MTPELSAANFDVYVGIDVDKKSYSVSFKHRQKPVYKSLKMPSNPSTLISYFKKRCPEAKILYNYEAGPTGYHLYDSLKAYGQTCIMVHPASLERAPKDRVKTNRLDSLKLCRTLEAGHLRGIRVPDEVYRQLRHLISARQHYAQSQRRAKQQIESFLLFEHVELPELERSRWSKRHIEILKGLKLESVRRFKLDSFLSDLVYARQRLLIVERELRAFYVQNEAIRRHIRLLRSIPGFGFVVSAYFLSRIGDPAGLKNAREIGSFAGVVPSERSTGDKVKRGGITHMGDSMLRSLLVEAAWAAIQKDIELKHFFNRIKSKHSGNGGARIAIVAVARKLTHRAHKVLKEQRSYIVH